jgi:hypothetical protein
MVAFFCSIKTSYQLTVIKIESGRRTQVLYARGIQGDGRTWILGQSHLLERSDSFLLWVNRRFFGRRSAVIFKATSAHFTADRHTGHPSYWSFLETFKAGFVALCTGSFGAVALDRAAATCPACIPHVYSHDLRGKRRGAGK